MENVKVVNKKKNDSAFVCSYCGKSYDTVEEMAKCILSCSDKAKNDNKEKARKIAEEKIKKVNDEKTEKFNTLLHNIGNCANDFIENINKYINDDLFTYTGNDTQLTNEIIKARKSLSELFSLLENVRKSNKFNATHNKDKREQMYNSFNTIISTNEYDDFYKKLGYWLLEDVFDIYTRHNKDK